MADFEMEMKLAGFIRLAEHILELKEQTKSGETFTIIGANNERLVIKLIE